jgi:hypothetical protein
MYNVSKGGMRIKNFANQPFMWNLKGDKDEEFTTNRWSYLDVTGRGDFLF